jgi:hypothetical protein
MAACCDIRLNPTHEAITGLNSEAAGGEQNGAKRNLDKLPEHSTCVLRCADDRSERG